MAKMPNARAHGATLIKISAAERERERVLRAEFDRFWNTSEGDARTVYDAFILGSPIATGVTFKAIDGGGVRGWWIHPQRAKPASATLFLHGGGYCNGSSAAYRGFVSQIVERTDVSALVIDYPLAPEATVPAPLTAALTAWRLLIAQGFDRIAIVGDSAGGGLTLVTIAELTKSPDDLVPIAGVAFSPWADLTLSGRSMKDPTVVDPLIDFKYLHDCASKYLGGTDATSPLASPLFGDLRNLPPVLIQVGEDEVLVDDAKRYANRAAEVGAPVKLEIWEGMHHVFQLDAQHLESSRHALDRAGDFLRSAFNR
jgi:epsilon-lactone hydrolase